MYALNTLRIFSPLCLLLAIQGITACSSEDLSGPVSGTTSANGTTLITNPGVVSQNNFSIWASDLQPKVFDLTKGTFTFTEVTISVRLGDKRNNPLTNSQTVHFMTEWGLIDENCVTVDGICSVTWRTTSTKAVPADHLTTVLAHTNGEESFTDSNGNFIFDDSDTSFSDIEEPFVDSNQNGIYDAGEPVVDVPNGNDATGANGVHDIGDGFFNSAECTHSSLCSTTTSIAVWADLELNLDGPPATP